MAVRPALLSREPPCRPRSTSIMPSSRSFAIALLTWLYGVADGVGDALGGEESAVGSGGEHHHGAQAHIREGVDLHNTSLPAV